MKYETDCNTLLTPIEQRYLSTCYPLPDRPFYDELILWKENLRKASMSGETVKVSIKNIAKAFPHIGRLYFEGAFDGRSIQEYFEGTDEKSHNMLMYLFAKKASRKNIPENILKEILNHIEVCSVKPVDIKNSRVWSYSDCYQTRLDMQYFDLQCESDKAFAHGISEKGIIVVRNVTENEFEELRCWFKKRQKSRNNPFNRFL